MTVFKFAERNDRIDYITTNRETPTREQIKPVMKARWSIEVYHLELKKRVALNAAQARTGRAQRNHIFIAISPWLQKYQQRLKHKISFYQKDWLVIKSSIAKNLKLILEYR